MINARSIPFRAAVLSAAVAFLSCSAAPEAPGGPGSVPPGPQWSQFACDAACSGRSPYRGPQTGRLKWRFTLPSWGSGVVIGGGGTAYVGTRSGILFALKADGSPRWRFRLPPVAPPRDLPEAERAEWRELRLGGSIDSVALGPDGTIYFGQSIHVFRGDSTSGYSVPGPERKLYALRGDGTVKWSLGVGRADIATHITLGADGTVYFGTVRGPYRRAVCRFHAVHPDGTAKWDVLLARSGSLLSAAIGPDGTIYVGGDRLRALDPEDGSRRWELDIQTTTSIAAAPAVDPDGTIYVCTPPWTKENHHKLLAVHPDGTVKWSLTVGAMETSPAIAADGTIYITSWVTEDARVERGIKTGLTAITAEGRVKWSYETSFPSWHFDPDQRGRPWGSDSSPIVGSDGTIYFGADTGLVYAIRPDGSLKWRFGMGGEFDNCPAIDAESTLYICHSGGPGEIHGGPLRCYAISDRGAIAPPAPGAESSREARAVTFTFPATARFHVPDAYNTATRVDARMVAREPFESRLCYGLVLLEDGGRWTSVSHRAAAPNAPSPAVRITATDDGMALTLRDVDPRAIRRATFASMDEAVADYRAWLEEAYGAGRIGRAPNKPAWLAKVRLVFTIDLWRPHGEIAQEFGDVTRFVEEVHRAGAPRDTLLYLCGWSGPYDGRYPEYRPAEPLGGAAGFRTLVRRAHRYGYRVMIHTCPVAFDPWLPSFAAFEDCALKGGDHPGGYRGWPGGYRSRRLDFDSGRRAVTREAAALTVPGRCEARLTVGGFGGARPRVTVRDRALAVPRDAPDPYTFPFTFFFEEGENRVAFSPVPRGLWFRVHDPLQFIHVWTTPFVAMDPGCARWRDHFTRKVVDVVRAFGLDAVHLDAHVIGGSTWDGLPLFEQLMEALPGVAFSCEEALGEIGLRVFGLTQGCRTGADEDAALSPLSAKLAEPYLRFYWHLVGARSFVPVGVVWNLDPPAEVTAEARRELDQALARARDLGVIPTLRVNAREFGLDPDTRRWATGGDVPAPPDRSGPAVPPEEGDAASPAPPFVVNCGPADRDEDRGEAPASDAVVLPDVPYSPSRGYGHEGGEARGGWFFGEFVGPDPRALMIPAREGAFAYRFDLARGAYRVQLGFFDHGVHGPGIRVFDIACGDEVIAEHVDPHRIAGLGFGFRLTARVDHPGGPLRLRFIPRTERGATVSLIRILPRGPAASPQAPQGVRVVSGYGRNALFWTPLRDPTVDRYEVLRARAPEGPFRALGGGAIRAPWYFDDDAPLGRRAWYRVRAIAVDGKAGAPSDPRPARAEPLASARLPLYEIAIDPPALAKLRHEPGSDEMVPGRFRFRDRTWPVEVRFRGASTRWLAKGSFKVRFPREDPFEGRRTLALKAEQADWTLMQEELSYDVTRAAGVPCSATRYVAVALNGEYLGVYLDVEFPDDAFKRRAGLDPAGLLARMASFGHLARDDPDEPFGRRRGKAGEIERLRDLFEALNRIDEGDIEAFLQRTLDVEEVLRHLAVNALTAQPETEADDQFLYRDPASGRWIVIPWDRNNGNWGIQPFDLRLEAERFSLWRQTLQDLGPEPRHWHLLWSRLLHVPALRARYLELVASLAREVLDPAWIGARIEENTRAIREDALRDVYRWPRGDAEAFLRGPAALREFAAFHRERLLREVDRARGIRAVLVINEFLARPPGGEAPWIEVRDVGDRAVDLAGLRIAPSLPGEASVALPPRRLAPGDRCVVRLEGEARERLRPEGGGLALVRGEEDEEAGGRVLDFLYYGRQGWGIAYGRDPDPPHRFQYRVEPTPGARNAPGIGGAPPPLRGVSAAWRHAAGRGAGSAEVVFRVLPDPAFAGVTAFFAVGEGPWHWARLTPSGEWLEATAPVAGAGAPVRYYLLARSAVGLERQDPPAAPYRYRVLDAGEGR